MGRLSALLRSVEGGRLMFWCPGCDGAHMIRVDGPNAWGWNRNVDAPTFTPSVLVTYDGADAGIEGAPPARCHSFVTNGQIQFLSDCTHALANRTAPLPPYPEDRGV